MMTSSTIVIILCALSAGLALGLVYKALRLAKLLEMQVELQRRDMVKHTLVGKTLNADILSTEVKLNKRRRKLEQKDGQIQNWVTTSVDCFENQQDQIDTPHNTVFGKPALDKPAGEKKDD